MVTKTKSTNQDNGDIRNNIKKIGDAKEGTLVSEIVIRLILRDARQKGKDQNNRQTESPDQQESCATTYRHGLASLSMAPCSDARKHDSSVMVSPMRQQLRRFELQR